MHSHDASRRRFLQLVPMAGAAALGIGRYGGAGQTDKTATVTLCFSLYGMRSLELDAALAACARIGYDGVELDATAGQSGDPKRLSKERRAEVRRWLQQQGLRLPALMENLALLTDRGTHRRNLDRLKAVAALGHELSPENPPIIETVLGGRPQQWPAVKDKMAAALEDWAKTGEQARCVIAIKAHVGGALHSPHDTRWLVDRVESPWIRVNYDYSHFQLRGYGLKESLERLLPRTVFIHVKDARGKVGDFRFLLPGEGDTDYAEYFGLLKQAGYRGALCVEVSGQIHRQPGYDPVAAARQSYSALSPALKKAGIVRT